MCWTRVFVLSVLTALLVLTISSVVDGAAVRDGAKAEEPKAQEEEVFVPEPDVSNVFKYRGRRSLEHYYRALSAERARRAGPDRQTNYEQQRRDYEHYIEEARNARERPTEYQWMGHQWMGNQWMGHQWMGHQWTQHQWMPHHYGSYYPLHYYWHQ